MKIRNKLQMYVYVSEWFQRYLEDLFPNTKILIHDSHATKLSEVVAINGLQQYFVNNIWQTYDFMIDVVGFIIRKRKLDIAFLKCETKPISLLHIAKILGYCQVVNPLMAYLISPKGAGTTLSSLLMSYNRTDILEYHWETDRQPRRISIAKWNEMSNNIDFDTLLPPGAASNIGMLK